MTTARLSLVAASLAAILQTAAPAPAAAADINDPAYGYYPKPGSPYEDPRYADIYGYGPRRRPVEPPRYAERAPPPYRDDYAERPRFDWPDREYLPPRRYLEPLPVPPRFSEHDGRRYDRRYACTPRHEVKRELHRQGWSDFHEVRLEGEFAVVRARRPSGRLFELSIDRCSGEIASARPLAEGRPYAWRDRYEDYRRY
jgi:hypothetical protein